MPLHGLDGVVEDWRDGAQFEEPNLVRYAEVGPAYEPERDTEKGDDRRGDVGCHNGNQNVHNQEEDGCLHQSYVSVKDKGRARRGRHAPKAADESAVGNSLSTNLRS